MIRRMTEYYFSIPPVTAQVNILLIITPTTCGLIKLGLRIRKLDIQIITRIGASFPPTPIMLWGLLILGGGCFAYYVGRTWFANSSPGGGYLQVAINDNNTANNAQLNALLAKLAPHENDEAGYMSCNNTGNPNQCSYIVNSGLTPTAGTLQLAINYFNGTSGNASPIQYSCQKNYIVFVTDGLPSNDENGNPGSASSLMPAVLNKLNSLQNLTVTGSGSSSTYDVQDLCRRGWINID